MCRSPSIHPRGLSLCLSPCSVRLECAALCALNFPSSELTAPMGAAHVSSHQPPARLDDAGLCPNPARRVVVFRAVMVACVPENSPPTSHSHPWQWGAPGWSARANRYLGVQGGDLQDKHLTQGKFLFPEHARCDPAKPRCVQRAGRSHPHTAQPRAASHGGG